MGGFTVCVEIGRRGELELVVWGSGVDGWRDVVEWVTWEAIGGKGRVGVLGVRVGKGVWLDGVDGVYGFDERRVWSGLRWGGGGVWVGEVWVEGRWVPDIHVIVQLNINCHWGLVGFTLKKIIG